jgi:hypothetical protein
VVVLQIQPHDDVPLMGRSLLPVMASIKTWAECHIEEVQIARMDYDRGVATELPVPGP